MESINIESLLVIELNDLGIGTSFETRENIARAVSIKKYSGKLKENIKLLKIIKEGIKWHKI